MKTTIIIPARYGSTRFPGKPLHAICGVSMIERVWRLAKAVEGVHSVVVATDDDRIQKHVEAFGGTAVMTPEDCANGTERVYAAAQSLEESPDILINLQGDAPLTPPWVIQPVVDAFKDKDVQVATPAVQLDYTTTDKINAAKQAGEVGGTTVVTDKNNQALYFSKAVLPFLRERPATCPVWKHIGIYGYRMNALKDYMALPSCELEEVEGLEQLRYLYNGIPIQVVEADYKNRTPWSVDSPEDAERVAQIIEEEGELV